jgi:hypothetical protein
MYNSIQTGSGTHTASYPIGNGERGPYPWRLKRQEREGDHSPSSRAEVKNGGAMPPLPHTSSWRAALLIKQRAKTKLNIISYTFRFIYI